MIFRFNFKRLYFVFIIGLISPGCLGQLLGQFEEKTNLSELPYTVSNYNTQHGLIQGQITSLCRFPDSNTILFSNYNGLFTFNGYTFEVFTPSEGLENKVFKKLWLDSNTKKIYGYRGDDLFEAYPKFHWIGRYKAIAIQNSQIHTIDKRGRISINGKFLYQVKTKQQENKVFSQLYPVNNGYLIGQNNELLLFTKKNYAVKTILKEGVLSFVKKNLNEVYVLTTDNVWVYNAAEESFTKLFESPNKNIFYNDLIQINSNILITSDLGLYIFDLQKRKLSHFNEKNVLPTNILNFISYDSNQECLFIGTGNKGLLKLESKTAQAGYEMREYMTQSFASTLAVPNVGVYSASRNNLILFDKTKVKKVISLPIYVASLSRVDSSIYAGSWGDGIVQLNLDGKVLHHFQKKNNNFHGVFKDHNGDMWIAYTYGVKKGKDITKCKDFAKNQIKMQVVSLFENSKNELFIGGDDGFRILSPDRKKIKLFDKKHFKDIGEIRSFLEDKNGGTWIGSYGGGLFYLKNNRLIALKNKPNYLLGNEIFTLALDKYKQVIITSNKGIKVIPLQKLHDFITGKIEYLVPFNVDKNKGIYNNEFNGGFQNNYASFDQENFYFPTLQGLIYYHSTPIPKNTEKITIKEIKSDEGSKPIHNLSFERDTKQITFSFFTPNLVESQNIYYQYKLSKKNEPKNWSLPQKETEIKLQNIEPGNYVFMVRSIDASNNPIPYYRKIEFKIKPYFYETWWFIAMLILIISGISAGIITYLFHKKRNRLTRIMEMNALLQETEIKAIHAQMNPHFIFNSLHLINHLIKTKKYSKAEDLLINFSKLLRNVLEKSDQLFLPIADELHFIELYLTIQKSRFDNQLNYEIQCDPNINQIQIPSMIIQPIVENALLHGIAHKMTGIGSISIKVYQEKNQIHIVIEDNGIGRKASSILNLNKSHRSAGYSLIEKKINLLKTKYKIDVSYSIIDIEENNQTGTIVHLIIDSLL